MFAITGKTRIKERSIIDGSYLIAAGMKFISLNLHLQAKLR